MHKILKTNLGFVALCLAVSITGCGGGGDGGGQSLANVGSVCAGVSCIDLGTAGNYAILAKTGVDTVPASVVTGNIGLSPAARGFLTGWDLVGEPRDYYFTSAQVVAPGKLYASDNLGTTPVLLTTAVNDMGTAYTAAAGQTPTSAETINIGMGTLDATVPTATPGVYNAGVYEWGMAVNITESITLNGSATDVWIFKVGGTLDMAANKSVILSGGALSQNIFWQVAEAVSIGVGTHFEGIVLGQTSIDFGSGASLNGRLLAQTAVNLIATTVTVP